MKELPTLIAVALFGGVGAVARWGIARGAAVVFGTHFAWGTLLANVLGCFLMGLLIESSARPTFSPYLRTALAAGFLGSLTTFSTFSAETLGFMHEGRMIAAIGNISGNLILGLLAVVLGMALSAIAIR